jgi:hypothetical protein
MFDVVNVVLVQVNGNRVRFSYERPEYHISGDIHIEKRNYYSSQIVCVATQEVHSCKLIAFPILIWL